MRSTGPIIPALGKLYHRGDYNPDQWDEQTCIDDVRLMQPAKVNLARTGILASAHVVDRGLRGGADLLTEAACVGTVYMQPNSARIIQLD